MGDGTGVGVRVGGIRVSVAEGTNLVDVAVVVGIGGWQAASMQATTSTLNAANPACLR